MNDMLFSVTVNPSGVDAPSRTIRIKAAASAQPVLGLFRVQRNGNGLLCGGTTAGSPPAVADFTYYFQLVPDCNNNGAADTGELGQTGPVDCAVNGGTANGILDCYEIAQNPYLDQNTDGRQDTCAPFFCQSDVDQNLQIQPADVSLFVNWWNTDVTNGTVTQGDFDHNGVVDASDVAAFINRWYSELNYPSACNP